MLHALGKRLSMGTKNIHTSHLSCETSIDVLQSKNQALCEYCTHVNKLKHC